MDIAIVVILLVVGVIFFIVELFLIPGISLAGIAGTVFAGAGVYYAYSHIGVSAGNITLFSTVLLLGIAIWIFVRSKTLDRLSLKTDISGKNDPLEKMDIHVGDKGVTSSRLAPMGKVKINGNIIEAKTNDDFIDPGVEIVITQIYSTNVLVERLQKN